jgi:hypothetical protein
MRPATERIAGPLQAIPAAAIDPVVGAVYIGDVNRIDAEVDFSGAPRQKLFPDKALAPAAGPRTLR